jgi:dTDP-4-dehydrorhamnose 3,5-epimerase
MSRFSFQTTPLSGLYVVQREVAIDKRGFFSRLFCQEEFRENGFLQTIAQINSSYTRLKGTIRGLHFQYPPKTELKIVTCLRGEVFDASVDIRHGSPTFMQWHGEILSENNRKTLVIPEGLAHGFQSLSDDVELLYFTSAAYDSVYEGGLHYADTKIAIKWPLIPTEISEKDQQQPWIGDAFSGIVLGN